MQNQSSMLSNKIKNIAESEGIDIIRITDASPFDNYNVQNSVRRSPHLSVKQPRAIIICGIYIGGFSLPDWDNPIIGKTNRLFLSGYYSDVVKPIQSILNFLTENGYEAKMCDSFQSNDSILPLKLAAVRAGIGWQGKNTLFISPVFGSFLALGGIITNAELEFDNGIQKDQCGTCEACIKACPTGALNTPYKLNRQICLSNILEIETECKEVSSLIGNMIFGCEICQEICPWNKKHIQKPKMTERTKNFQKKVDKLSEFFMLSNLSNLSENDFNEFINTYPGDFPYRIFKRNVKIASMNSKRNKNLSY
jgi:epoxyqueuosine reductase